jgi:hypothetical protein
MSIARNGYADPLEMAFFPGLPGVMRAGALIGLPMPVTGALLALICSLVAALALFRIGGTVPACLWLIAPTAVFTTVGYTEAPFCAAAFWAWERARAGKWWPAAGLAALACTLRVSGLFLVGALAVMAVLGDGQWRDGRAGKAVRPVARTPAAIAGRLAPLLLPLAVLAGYVVYLHGPDRVVDGLVPGPGSGLGEGFHDPDGVPAQHPAGDLDLGLEVGLRGGRRSGGAAVPAGDRRRWLWGLSPLCTACCGDAGPRRPGWGSRCSRSRSGTGS